MSNEVKRVLKVLSLPLVMFIVICSLSYFAVKDITKHLEQPITIEKLEHGIICVTKPVLWGYQRDCFKGSSNG